MSPRFQKVVLMLAVGLLGASMLWALVLLAGASCSVLPVGICPLPR